MPTNFSLYVYAQYALLKFNHKHFSLLSSFTSSSPVKIINSFNNNTVGDGSFNNNANQLHEWLSSRRDEMPLKPSYPGFSPHIYSKKSSSRLCCRGYLMYIEEKIPSTYYVDSQGRRYLLTSSGSMTPYGSGGRYLPYGGSGGGYLPYGGSGYLPYGGSGGGYLPYGGDGGGYSPYDGRITPYGGGGGGYSPYSGGGIKSGGIGGYLLYGRGRTPHGIGGYLLYSKGGGGFSPYGGSGQYSLIDFDDGELPYLRRQHGGRGRGGRRRGGRRRGRGRWRDNYRGEDYRDYEDDRERYGGRDKDGTSIGGSLALTTAKPNIFGTPSMNLQLYIVKMNHHLHSKFSKLKPQT
ncbi:hypothetical protein X798_07022, partial [Onchocerca flexuosa]